MATQPLICLSLTQMWATLVMLGEKGNETRNWWTSYRGLLGIHASSRFPKDARELCRQEPFKSVLMRAGYESLADLPLGALLGTVQLVRCARVEMVRTTLSEQERAFGDYSDRRYAFVLTEPTIFASPIPMKGRLGLWTCELPRLDERHQEVGHGRR